jgi:glycosyltransferase involved in cell wall biosynthesis
MKKILFVVPVFNKSNGFGGVVTAISDYVQALKNHAKITVYTSSILNLNYPIFTKSKPEYDLDGVTVKSFSSINFPKPAFVSISMFFDIIKKYKSFDLVYISSIWQLIGPFTALACRLRNIPYIIAPHGSFSYKLRAKNTLIKKLYYSLFLKSIIKHSHSIHVTCENEISDSKGWVLKDKAIVVPNVLSNSISDNIYNPSLRQKLKLSDDDIIILNVGRSDWKKRNDLIIHSLLKDSRLNFVFVGDFQNSIGYSWINLVKKYNLNDRVFFTGHKTKSQLDFYYRGSDIFVLLSENENFGLVVGEAIIAECNVVISKEVGIGEYLTDFSTVKIIDKENEVDDVLIREYTKSKINHNLDELKVNKSKILERLGYKNVGELFIKRFFNE